MTVVVDVCKASGGKIWHRKLMPSSDDGQMVTITHSVSTNVGNCVRNIRFLRTSFDKSGDCFVAGDHQGNIFSFDLSKNRYSLCQKTGYPCTALCYSWRRPTEFLVALSDYTLKCFNTESKDIVAWLKGHQSAIHSISIHSSGRYALTTSLDTAHLWDLDTFQRKRKLNNRVEVGLHRAFFLPMTNLIITCFRDDSIFAWDCETLSCKYQLPVPSGTKPQYRTFAPSRDGRYLAAAGRSRFIHLWSMDTHRLLRVIEMPSKVTAVKQLEFLPDTFQHGFEQVLGALSQDGIMRFINTDTCCLLFDVGAVGRRLSNVGISPNGRYLAGVLDDGNIGVFSLQALCADINKPPAPLVKVVKSNKMADNTTTSTESVLLTGVKKVDFEPAKIQIASIRSDCGSKNTRPHCSLNVEKLRAILKGYAQYPDKYRMFIWRKIFCLPENHAAYGALVDKGVHSAYVNLHKAYPIKSSKLLRILQRILSALAHWAPIFGETQFLPSLAFPFVKLFQNNHLVCFEMIATVLVNMCQHWFEYFPNPPINIMSMVENVLAHHDRHLLQHFVDYGITSQFYAWPLLETLFSEVLTREEWLTLWDHVVSNDPSFLLLLAVAYSICCRGPLLQCTEFDDFQYFFHRRNAVDVRQVIDEAYRLDEATPRDVHPSDKLSPFAPLTQGQYPVFNKYPKFIVDYQVQERERIRHEEAEFLRKKQLSLDAQRMTLLRQQEEEQWYQQQKLLLEAEEKRRQMIAGEEQMLTDQRQRLLAMQRETKLKELKLMDAVRRKFLHFHRQQREAELRRLDDEVQRKGLLREQETQNAIEEAEIRGLELELQKKMFEQEQQREFALSSVGLRLEQEVERKQVELGQQVRHKLQDAEREHELEVRKEMQQKLAVASQRHLDMQAGQEMESCFRADHERREADDLQLSQVILQNRETEREVCDLINQCQVVKDQQTKVGLEELALAKQHRNMDRQLKSMELEIAIGQQQGPLDLLDGRKAHPQDLTVLSNITDESNFDDRPSRVKFEQERQTFDRREVELLRNVRQLRQKLAADSRHRRPPPPLSASGDN